jgi:hypothetical protein
VSSNEEYVRLSLVSGPVTVDLGARNHNYLLLTLARKRLEDVRISLAEDASGWIDLEDWAHDPDLCPPRLNLDVHRIRKQFADRGFDHAFHIIERRIPTKQIRLGVASIHIEREEVAPLRGFLRRTSRSTA